MINIPGLNISDKTDRIDSGTGEVRARTIEIGDVVIVINNIGSIAIIETIKNPLLLIIGIIIAVIGIALIKSSFPMAVILIAAGGGLAYWAHNRKLDKFLLIGTSDGRRTSIVSKDKQFLINIRDFLMKKIDANSEQLATINISNSTITAENISGGVAIGTNAFAAGEQSQFGSVS